MIWGYHYFGKYPYINPGPKPGPTEPSSPPPVVASKTTVIFSGHFGAQTCPVRRSWSSKCSVTLVQRLGKDRHPILPAIMFFFVENWAPKNERKLILGRHPHFPLMHMIMGENNKQDTASWDSFLKKCEFFRYDRSSYCWCFRNPKQPPFGCIKPCK